MEIRSCLQRKIGGKIAKGFLGRYGQYRGPSPWDSFPASMAFRTAASTASANTFFMSTLFFLLDLDSQTNASTGLIVHFQIVEHLDLPGMLLAVNVPVLG